MFKIGDIVRCRTNKYGITSYKRPCEIVDIPNKEYIGVRCLGGDGKMFEVYTDLFELVPKNEILHKGMIVKDKYGEKYKFIFYGIEGIIVEHTLINTLEYDNILYSKQFIV